MNIIDRTFGHRARHQRWAVTLRTPRGAERRILVAAHSAFAAKLRAADLLDRIAIQRGAARARHYDLLSCVPIMGTTSAPGAPGNHHLW